MLYFDLLIVFVKILSNHFFKQRVYALSLMYYHKYFEDKSKATFKGSYNKCLFFICFTPCICVKPICNFLKYWLGYTIFPCIILIVY